MIGLLVSSAVTVLALSFSGFIGKAEASDRTDVFIADNTYAGQAAELRKMPIRFEANGTFKASRLTAMCPEVPKYVKSYDGMFLTLVDRMESAYRGPADQYKDVGEQLLKFALDNKLCTTLVAGSTVNVVGAIMNLEGCHVAWETDEYNLKYPNTHSFACFYYPLTEVDGVTYAVPGLHLEGFDEWAAEEWKNHSQ